MAIDGVVMECASERMAAFEVQQRFLQHWGPTIDTLDYSARCRQMGEVGGNFTISLPCPRIVCRWPLGMPPGRDLPQR